jgi:hypothetical protein
MEAVEQFISLIILLLFYIDGTATYWSLSVMERYNASALNMEQNRIARWVFGQLGIKAGYLIWMMFVMAALSCIIYYCSLFNVLELIWGLFVMGIIIAQLHSFNYRFIKNNLQYQKTLEELDIKQVQM